MNQAKLNRKINISRVLGTTIKEGKLVQKEIARRMHVTPSAIAHLKKGDMPLQFENIEALMKATGKQNQFLAMEISNKMVGITTPVIDGDKIMKEPLAMAVKTMPELSQAMTSIQKSMDEMTIPSDQLKKENLEDPEELVKECFDAVLYLMNLIAYVCKAFGFSMQDMLKQRVKRWVMKGIVKGVD
ncbi:helix-turn-helix domain-containing protein [Latilactobacillus curvatus]|uniref:helix-turn-helix domain-containing protein n=1 Tax=Latilactobacillus curvatus TaxID=28038 RepID=UPI000FECB26C|nr:helix-turn-helix transcriptional regulator [Latilactobacillus curvatus]QAR35236.1 XRE family transcriptional regulator [Latilactobacillus curvatus]